MWLRNIFNAPAARENLFKRRRAPGGESEKATPRIPAAKRRAEGLSFFTAELFDGNPVATQKPLQGLAFHAAGLCRRGDIPL